jgi:hypothetical protein
MIQTITPNPNIPCKPGWCLAYVNEAFRVPKRHGSATAAWRASGTKHRDYDFPAGCWVPVWFGLSNEPNGHVALLAPDGSVYSTSDNSTTPHHHPDLADLIGYYAHYGMRLTYLGWTEDVEGTPVIAAGIQTQSSTIEKEWDEMASMEDLANVMKRDDVLEEIAKRVHTRPLPYYIDGRETGQATTVAAMVGNYDSNLLVTWRVFAAEIAGLRGALAAATTDPAITPESLTEAFKEAVGEFSITLTTKDAE